jgi:hypothetical protein
MAWPRLFAGARGGEREDSDGRLAGRPAPGATTPGELLEWPLALTRSMLSDPAWHMSWTREMQRQWAALMAGAGSGRADPRAAGLLGGIA